jgi:hypothetical protein
MAIFIQVATLCRVAALEPLHGLQFEGYFCTHSRRRRLEDKLCVTKVHKKQIYCETTWGFGGCTCEYESWCEKSSLRAEIGCGSKHQLHNKAA